MIVVYVGNNYLVKVFDMFECMIDVNIEFNRIMFLSIFKVCNNYLILEKGRKIYIIVKVMGMEIDVVVVIVLIIMYFKCGEIFVVCEVFYKMMECNVVLWMVII